MKKRGIYSKKVKNEFIHTKPSLDKKELVMVLNKGEKKIVNQIMQSWETAYMKRLASIATSKGGHVLEIGFGMGISSSFIQKSKKIKNHTVVECHPLMIDLAKNKFSKQIKSGRLILKEGFWEDVTKKIPSKSFDGILFDSCPLDSGVEFFQFFPFFNEAFRLLKDGGVFTYFSDEVKEISVRHKKELRNAGFKNIGFKICKVNPPKTCEYWRHNTIIAPIIKKS
jgi:guanidinoacetate N-methyltransferase